MPAKLLDGYNLEQLRDYSLRDRLLRTIFTSHQRHGAPKPLAARFLVRFDNLIGLILNDGPHSEAVHTLFEEMQEEFAFCRCFDEILLELSTLIGPQGPRKPPVST